jgi:hypothetical protein
MLMEAARSHRLDAPSEKWVSHYARWLAASGP